MKFLFDLFPVILFFGVFKWGKVMPTPPRAWCRNTCRA